MSLVNTEEGSEQGNVHPVVTIPGKREDLQDNIYIKFYWIEVKVDNYQTQDQSIPALPVLQHD